MHSQIVHAVGQRERCCPQRCCERIDALPVYLVDGTDGSVEQAFEQLTDWLKQHTARIRILVEPQHGVPTGVEREVAAGDEHP